MHNCQKNYNNSKITIARNIDQIEAIRPIWEKMQQNENSPKPNADIDRYLSTITSAEQKIEPYVILLHNNNQPQAILIGRIENAQIPCRLGYKTLFNPSIRCIIVVYGGIIGQLNPDVSALLIQTLINSLKRGDADVLFFNHLRLDSLMYQFATTKPNILCRHHFPLIEPHWQTKVPDTVEDLYSRFGRKRRKEWKRLSKRLEEAAGGQIEVKSYRHECQIDEFARIASKISTVTYKDKIGAGFEDTSQTRSLLVQAAQSNWWRGYVLYAGDEPCAFESGVIYERTYFAEVIGYDHHWGPFSPGTILFIKVLEELCRSRSVNIFDYGFGNAEYKERFGTDFWLEGSVHIFAPRLYPILLNLALTSTSAASGALNYLVTKAGVYNWVKRHWRNLLRKKAAPANNQEVN